MITALGDFVVLEVIPVEDDVTDTGIILAKDDSKRSGDDVKLFKGKVLSIGGNVDISIEYHDIILYNSYDANFFKKGTKQYAIIQYQKIHGKLDA